MTYSVQSLLPALAPHCAKLVGPAALERIAGLAGRLPAVGSCGSFELHLGTGADRADLLLASDDEGGRRALSRALAQDPPLPPGPALKPLLAEWAFPGAPLRAWTSLLWLEYDLPEGGEDRAPMAYFGLLGLSPSELGDLARRTRRLLTGRAAESALISTLEHCARSLPEGGRITFFADPCRARGVRHVRLVAQIPRAHAWSWLQSIGWPGRRDQWEHAASAFTNGPDHVSLYIDVADTVGPKLGIETTLPAPDSAREQWEELAERLAGLGAATAQEFAAVLSWAGGETVDLPGHESLVRIGRTPGFKLVMDAGGALSAKGYLAFKARNTLF